MDNIMEMLLDADEYVDINQLDSPYSILHLFRSSRLYPSDGCPLDEMVTVLLVRNY